MSLYEEPSTRIVTLLRDVYKDGPIKAVFDGDPDIIPTSYLPAICVVQQNDTNNAGDSGSDHVTCQVQVRVVFDKRADWGIKRIDQDLTDTKIRQLVEARDPNTGMYLAQTIKGALRGRLELDPSSFMHRDMQFELGSQLRTTGSDDILTREGVLTITIEYSVDVPNMS